MSKVLELKTGYAPKREVAESLTLPIQLKNSKGEVIASIEYWAGSEYMRKGYYGFVNNHNVRSDGFDSFTECVEATFGHLYSKMQEYRKVAEKHWELQKVLRGLLG